MYKYEYLEVIKFYIENLSIDVHVNKLLVTSQFSSYKGNSLEADHEVLDFINLLLLITEVLYFNWIRVLRIK